MTDLPPGWEWTTLGDIANTTLGKMLDRGKTKGHPEVPYLRNADVQWGRINTDNLPTMELPAAQVERFSLEKGDLLVCEGGEIGRAAVWPGHANYVTFQKAIHRVRPNERASSDFIRYYLQWMQETGLLKDYSTGSTIKHLPQANLRILPILLPPISEQRRIVAHLDECLMILGAGVDSLARAKERIDGMLKGAFSAAADGTISLRQSNLRDSLEECRRAAFEASRQPGQYKHPCVPDLQKAPSAPPTWTIASLEAVTDPVRRIRYGILKPRVGSGGEIPYIEVRDLRGDLSVGSLRTTSRDLDEQFKGARVRPGDVVLAVRGSFDKSAVVPPGHDGTNISRDVVRIAPLPLIEPRWIHLYLQSHFAQDYLLRHARGVAVKGVNVSSIRALPIAFPSLRQQREILEEVDGYTSAARTAERLLCRVERYGEHLRKSLLRKVSAGESAL